MVYRKEEEYIDKLEKNLYKRDRTVEYKKQKLAPHEIKAKKNWKSDARKVAKKNHFASGIFLKIFFASVLFFVVASGIAFYRLVFTSRISPENVEIVVQAPASVQGGEETSVQIIVKNDNTSAIEFSNLNIVFPDGARYVPQQNEENYRYQVSLGPIASGDQVIENLPIILFGEENTEKVFDIDLEYRVEGSSALFSKNKIFPLALSTSPISLSVSLPAEVNVGEEISIDIISTSNSNSVLEDFMIAVEFPFGFTFEGADPRPSKDTNVWHFGDLMSSGTKKIEIRGRLEGQTDEKKTFKVFAGKESEFNPRELEIVFNSVSKTVPIRQPFIGVDFAINGNAGSSEVVVDSGRQITGSIDWINNLPSRILNGEIILKINGQLVDRTTIREKAGFYQSLNDSIIWNQTTDRSLSVIEPGQTGSARFSLKTSSLFKLGGVQYKNPRVTLEFEFNGERVSPGFPSEPIQITGSKIIKLNTAVQLATKGVYYTSPIPNSGPLPPRVDQETQYTIVWSIVNSSNDIENATIEANLPIYINWLGVITPTNESVQFNELTGQVSWNAGDISTGVGSISPAREVAFQVSLTPSISQIDTSPTIVSEVEFSGRDTFTGSQIELTDNPVTTRLNGDPQVRSSETKVLK